MRRPPTGEVELGALNLCYVGRRMNARLVCGCLAVLLSGCPRSRPNAPADASAPRVDAERVPAIAEVPPMGAAPDGSEVDVPLSWIYLLTDPAPTGSTPYAVLGARVPCAFVPRYTVSERGDGEIRLRMRAQRRDAGHCEGSVEVVEQVSLSLVRLGTWLVVDAVPHGPADAPVPAARTLHVVPDDGALRPAAERWTRFCEATADCTAGGECVRAGPSSICQPAMDPWLHLGRPCPEGTRSTLVAPVAADAGAPHRACVAACVAGRCPGELRCDTATGTCLPSRRVDAGTFGSARGLPSQGSDAARR